MKSKKQVSFSTQLAVVVNYRSIQIQVRKICHLALLEVQSAGSQVKEKIQTKKRCQSGMAT